jgi:hypothetical protein
MSKEEYKLSMPVKKQADQWVTDKKPKTDAVMKRFTIDVPADLHMRIKAQCAMRGTNMTDVLRELLGREFPDDRVA